MAANSLDTNTAIVGRNAAMNIQDRINHAAVQASLKKGIWIYFALLIVEGGLRKWIFPSLATPLLVVRDPVTLWILYTAFKAGYLPNNVQVRITALIACFSLFTAMMIGHRSVIVAAYGTRILLFHFPLMFVIGKVFDREDVLKMGRILLWIALPMFVIITLQFYSPQSSFINKGIGGDSAGGGFSGALGFFRPPGTFSFTTGNTQFWSLVAVFILFFWLNLEKVNRLLLIAATITLIAAIPLSISRGLLIQVVLSIIFTFASLSRSPRFIGRMLGAVVGLVIMVALLSNFTFFKNAITVLTSRFDTAKESEGTINDTIINRSGASIMEPFDDPTLPFFGHGIGIGTNAGAKLLIGRSDIFLIAEGEWGRLIGEMGVVFGMIIIIVRSQVSLKLGYEAYKRLKSNNLLPWLLTSVSIQAVAQGQWAQPTALGFGIIMGGITIAAMKFRETPPPLPVYEEEAQPEPAEELQA